jgi:protein-tyrosine kinase
MNRDPLGAAEAAPALGLVARPDDEPPRWAPGTEVVIATTSMSPVAEALRTLRTQLALQWMNQRQVQLLSVVSAVRGEGRSFIAANLAVAFAQLHERTLLIDMDLRHARQHRIFRVDNDIGLSTLLAGHGNGREIRRIEGCQTLSLLPSGPRPAHPQEMLSARSLTPVLDQLRPHFDVIIIDTPAFSSGADAQIVSAQARQALLVSAPGRATRDETDRLVDSLRQVGVSIAGAAVNRR